MSRRIIPDRSKGFFQRLREKAARVIGGKAVREYWIGFEDDLDRDPNDPLNKIYRVFGPKRAHRTLPSYLMDEQHRQAYRYLIENPFIVRLANLKADFIVGGGIEPHSDDEQVAEFIERFWTDPINNLKKEHRKYALEYRLYGELIWEKVKNDMTGLVRLNPRDPLEVSYIDGHPKYELIPAQIVFRSVAQSEIRANIVNTIPAVMRGDLKPAVADVYYHRANSATGSLRGISDFYASMEWCDALDSASFTMLERMNILLTYIWHLKASNIDEKQADAFRKTLENARPSTALVTSKDVEIAAIAPDLKNADFVTGADFIKQQIAMATGVPENWLGKAGVANVGESASMDAPTLKSLSTAQAEYLCVLRETIDDVLEEGILRGSVPANAKELYTLNVAPVSKRELGSVVTAATQLAASLSNARNENWLTHEEAARVFRQVVGEIAELKTELPEEIVKALDQGVTPEAMADFQRLSDRIKSEENGHARIVA